MSWLPPAQTGSSRSVERACRAKVDSRDPKANRLLEPAPVVLLATTGKGWPDVMAMSWHTVMELVPPRVGCVVSRHGLRVPERVRNWADPGSRNPHPQHHRGRGLFVISDDTIRLPSRMKQRAAPEAPARA